MFYFIMLAFVVLGIGGVMHTLSQKSRRDKLHKLLEMNGYQQQDTTVVDDSTPVERVFKRTSKMVSVTAMLDKNVVAKAITVGASFIILFLLDATGLVPMESDVMGLAVVCIGVVVVIAPSVIKGKAIKGRMKSISNDLPFIIDMMAVCVQSGMTIEKALRYIADNTRNINEDIATLLDRAVLKTEVSGVVSALEQLYQEVPSNEVRMFCSTLQQSIKYGSSIYQVLLELSKEMREIQLLSMEEKVASLSAKMTIPMIAFIMFPLLIIVAGPGIIAMGDSWGG